MSQCEQSENQSPIKWPIKGFPRIFEPEEEKKRKEKKKKTKIDKKTSPSEEAELSNIKDRERREGRCKDNTIQKEKKKKKKKERRKVRINEEAAESSRADKE